MHNAVQQRRSISPVLLLAVLLRFFLPFFSVSCSSGLGQMKATVTGMDQVVGGEPEYSGFRPPQSGSAVTAQEEKSQISPTALIAVSAIIVGGGLGLPRPGHAGYPARWQAGPPSSRLSSTRS
jgi:hypothetical protein